MPVEWLERAIRFMRLGQNARGCVSWAAFVNHVGRDAPADEVDAAVGRGDFLEAADIIDARIAPAYRT